MHIYTFIQDFLRKRPGTVATNLSFAFLYPIQDIALPHYYGQLIESLTSNSGIVQNIMYVLIIFIVVEVGFILSDWHDIQTLATFQTYCRQEILKNVMKAYEANFSDMNMGDLMSKLVKIPYTVIIWYERLKQYIIPYALVFGFAVCYFGRYDKVLGVVLLITSVVYAGVITGIPQHYCREVSKEKDQMMNKIHEEIDDTLRNFIAMHGDNKKQEEEIVRLETYEELFTVKFSQTMKCLMNTKVYTSLVIIVFITTFIMRSYHLLRNKKLNAASFSSLFLIMVYVLNCMLHLESQLRDMIFDWGVICESDELFNKHPRSDKVRSYPEKHVASMAFADKDMREGIGMKHVSFSFPGSNKKILHDITFHIKKGETVVILGDIGSGKSTILKLLLRFNEPDSGIVYIDGVPYDDLMLKDVKKKVGYVPQQPILFNRSVLENITYGNDNVTREQVEQFIKQIGVDKEFVNLEQGLDTKIGKHGSKLSGGQRQIVWTLRTYFQNPDVIVLDEPTASLDEKSKKVIKLLLSVIMKEKTTIIVTHDSSLLEVAERKLYVKNGRIVEGGQHGSDIKHGNDNGNGNIYVMKGGLLH